MDGLQERIRSDVRDTGGAVDQNVRERLKVTQYAEERPLLSVAAAFGGGVLLGMLTDSGGGGSQQQYSNGRYGMRSSGRRQESGNGLLASLLGSSTGMLTGTLQEQIRGLFDEVMSDRRQPEDRQAQEMLQRSEEELQGTIKEQVNGAQPARHRAA
jgi:hypothetical protein